MDNSRWKMGMFTTVTAAVMADPHCGDGKGRNLVSTGSCTSGNGRAIGTAWGNTLKDRCRRHRRLVEDGGNVGLIGMSQREFLY